MQIGNKVNKARTGFKEYYLAELITDTREELSYGEVYHFTDPVSLSVTPSSETIKGKAGNRDIETAQSKDPGTLTLGIWSISKEILEKITGAKRNANGTLVFKKTDVSPHFGLICRTTREGDSDGVGYDEFIGIPKVMFSLPADEATTKDGVEFTNVTLEGAISEREYDGEYKLYNTEADVGFDFELFLTDVFKTVVKEEETP